MPAGRFDDMPWGFYAIQLPGACLLASGITLAAIRFLQPAGPSSLLSHPIFALGMALGLAVAYYWLLALYLLLRPTPRQPA